MSPEAGRPEADAPARAVIADDERLMREQLRARLAEAWPALQIVGEARNGQEAVEQVAALAPDLVFLDIRMPVLDGIEAARRIGRLPRPADGEGCAIVFITAYDQHAIQAFEQGALDYVLKPAERERLQLTVQRLQAGIAHRRAAAAGSGTAPAPGGAAHREAAAAAGAPVHPSSGTTAAADVSGQPPAGAGPMESLLQQLALRLQAPAAAPRLRWIQAAVGEQIRLIPVEEVLFFISDEKYTRVQTAQCEALIRKPIRELVAELDPQLFWQIHRSTLVNAQAIAGVSRDLRGRQRVAVKGHAEKLEVSRAYAHLFRGM